MAEVDKDKLKLKSEMLDMQLMINVGEKVGMLREFIEGARDSLNNKELKWISSKLLAFYYNAKARNCLK